MILLATDLDRTLLPNGSEPDSGHLHILFNSLKSKNIKLAYVSGRNLPLLQTALKKYSLPLPDIFIGAVGTEIYQKNKDQLIPDPLWPEYVINNSPNWDDAWIRQNIKEPEINLQEPEVQNPFKVSFYCSTNEQIDNLIKKIKSKLETKHISAKTVYSFDPLKKIGLLDILPAITSKVGAIEYIRQQLQLTKDQVIYCGDSGNDIHPLTAGYKSIMVKNVDQQTRQAVTTHHQNNKTEHLLYQSQGGVVGNGHYASGILEGLIHFQIISSQDIFEQ
ncbi:MAG: HAD-IIB family hydrolase [Patescibacteria group bacterium]